MRSRPRRGKVWLLGLIALCALVLSSVAAADPPMRVARLAHINGAVSFSPAGEEEWVQASANRPLITGDRVWVDAGSRAELQFGGAAIRLGGSTSVTIINLDDRVAQFQLAQGTVNVRVRRLGPDDVVEVDTPQLAFTMRRAAEVRIDVDAQGATAIAMQRGEGEAWGESAAFTLAAGQWYRFFDSALRNFQSDVIPAPDDFDRWAFDRDHREERAVTTRYVAPEVIGYSDLDEYGSWSAVETYGNVWFPTAVPSGWAPYRYGQWAWIEPWGWTWVDDAPWGFAPFHYGRWAYVRERWCWVPGPVRARPVYAPALVAFVDGGNFRLSLSSGVGPGVAWFPLGPGEVYQPSYRVSRNYFTNINVSNTQINNAYVTNVYNNAGAASASYQHQRLPNAVTAVPASVFIQSRPVAQAAVPLSAETISRVRATPFAAIAPTRASLAAAGATASRPPGAALERQVVARTPPPTPVAPFAARQQSLAREPGKPLDPAAAAALAPAARAPAAPIKLVTPAQTGAPTPAPQTLNRAGVPPAGESARTGAPPPQAPAPPLGARPPTPVATPNAPRMPGTPVAPDSSAGAPPPATMTRTPPPAANVPPPRPLGVPPQPAITASPPSGPTSAPSNAPAYAPARPTPPSAAGEVRRVPVPPGGPGVGEAAVPAPPAPPPATIARPPAPQPAPAPEVKRVPPPPPTAAPPGKADGAKPEGRDSPRQEEGKAKQEEKKQDVK